jgi:hypothetical protein
VGYLLDDQGHGEGHLARAIIALGYDHTPGQGSHPARPP